MTLRGSCRGLANYNRMTKPLFSIITVTRNAEENIVPTLSSVAGQTCRRFEYLVMDGASTDATVSVARSAAIPDMTIISEPDDGLYDAMNKAMARTRGEYLIFLNAGDSLHSPDTLERLAAMIDRDHPDIIYGQTDIVGPDRRRRYGRHLTAPDHLSVRSFASGMVVCHQAFIVRRGIAPDYDLRYRLSADYDWCIRCTRSALTTLSSGLVIIDYLEEGLSTANRKRSLRERFAIMCRHFGVMPTLVRHIGFIPRFIRRRRLEKRGPCADK